MQRRAAGLVVLLLALAAMLALPQLFRPGLAGQASAAPMPEPPPLGACVDFEEQTPHVVDCATLHDGEVSARWLADDPDRPRRRDTTACDDALDGYLGRSSLIQVEGWDLAAPNIHTRPIWAPRAERVERRGWSACVLRPANLTGYSGTLGSLTGSGRWPGAFGQCGTVNRGAAVPCTAPHSLELLGTTSGIMPVGPGTELTSSGVPVNFAGALEERCFRLAQQLTSATDPTYAQQLTVEMTVVGSPAMGGSLSGYRSFSAGCKLTSRQLLVDSVLGLGDAPLPIG